MQLRDSDCHRRLILESKVTVPVLNSYDLKNFFLGAG